jgi:hypothetical protein
VILASLIVDNNGLGASGPCVVDAPRSVAALRSAQIFLSDQPGTRGSVYPSLPTGPARRTARRCAGMIARIKKAMFESMDKDRRAQRDSTFHDAFQHTDGLGEGPSPVSQSSRAGGEDAQPDDLMLAFLDLLPPSQTRQSSPQIVPVDSTTAQKETQDSMPTDGASLMSSWSMRDLLIASCLPSCVTSTPYRRYF